MWRQDRKPAYAALAPTLRLEDSIIRCVATYLARLLFEQGELLDSAVQIGLWQTSWSVTVDTMLTSSWVEAP